MKVRFVIQLGVESMSLCFSYFSVVIAKVIVQKKYLFFFSSSV